MTDATYPEMWSRHAIEAAERRLAWTRNIWAGYGASGVQLSVHTGASMPVYWSTHSAVSGESISISPEQRQLWEEQYRQHREAERVRQQEERRAIELVRRTNPALWKGSQGMARPQGWRPVMKFPGYRMAVRA